MNGLIAGACAIAAIPKPAIKFVVPVRAKLMTTDKMLEPGALLEEILRRY